MIKNAISKLFKIFGLSMVTTICFGHEPWLLTPQQIKYWQEKPLPPLFQHWNYVNSSLLVGVLSLILLVFVLHAFTQKNITNSLVLFPRNQFSNKALLLLRITTAGTLLIAAFGLIPRVGYPLYTPTLFVPDMQLTSLSLYWAWLKWAEVILAISLFSGIYLRYQSILLFLLTGLACILFPANMLLYFGYFIGISLYLFFGAPKKSLVHSNTLSNENIAWATYCLQFFTGIAFIISGAYKILYPSIDIGLLSMTSAFTFKIPYDLFTLLMASVEISCGLFIVCGVFIRWIALFLFLPFLYLGYILHENIFAHLFIYGILITFIINGNPNTKKSY